MALFEDMLPDVRGAAYGAPDPILLRALRRATQELCKSTQVWREILDDTYAQDGIGAYEFSAPFEAIVDKIIHVKLDGRLICTQVRPDDLKAQPETDPGWPRLYAQHSVRQELLLWPPPGPDEHDRVISVYAVLSPSQRAIDLPDALVDEWGQGIVARAKWDLLSNAPEQPWHNPRNGAMQREIADEVFVRAKRSQHSGHSTLLTVRPRRFM